MTPRAVLLVENPRKCSNLGPMLRCAAAYGITTVLAVGYAQCSVDGSHGASNYVTIEAYATVEQAVHHLRQEHNHQVSIVGVLGGLPMQEGEQHGNVENAMSVHEVVEGTVELLLPNSIHNHDVTPTETRKIVFPSSIRMDTATTSTTKKSYAVGSRPFDVSATLHCFVFSKFQLGMPISLAQVCDFFVHVPHRSCILSTTDNDTKEDEEKKVKPPMQILDRHACLSIVLHHFSEWAGYEERKLDGHKYQLETTTNNSVNTPSQLLALHQQRQCHKQALREEINQTETIPEASGIGMFANSQQQQDGDY